MFKELESHDLGCGVGGGRNDAEVFEVSIFKHKLNGLPESRGFNIGKFWLTFRLFLGLIRWWIFYTLRFRHISFTFRAFECIFFKYLQKYVTYIYDIFMRSILHWSQYPQNTFVNFCLFINALDYFIKMWVVYMYEIILVFIISVTNTRAVWKKV